MRRLLMGLKMTRSPMAMASHALGIAHDSVCLWYTLPPNSNVCHTSRLLYLISLSIKCGCLKVRKNFHPSCTHTHAFLKFSCKKMAQWVEDKEGFGQFKLALGFRLG